MIALAFKRSWRVLAAYGAFTAWGLACLCASVLLIMGTKAVPAISPSLMLTLAGIVGATVAGHFGGNVLALLRLRLWVVFVIGLFVAVGILIASAMMGPAAGFLVVGALAILGGYFGVASRMEIFAAWLPLTYAVGAAVLWMNNQGRVSIWLTGAKFAVWDAVTFAFLTGAVLLFLVFLMARHALALTLWADAAKPGARTIEIRAKAGRGSLLALVVFSGVVLLATAVISPFLFRSEVEHKTVVQNGHVTHPSTYTVTTSHGAPHYDAYYGAPYNTGKVAYGTGHVVHGTPHAYGGTGGGAGAGAAAGGGGGVAHDTPATGPASVDSSTSTSKIDPQAPPTDAPDDACDPDKSATALLNPACFNKLKTEKTTVQHHVTGGAGSPTVVMDGQVVNADGTVTKIEHGVPVGAGVPVGVGGVAVGAGTYGGGAGAYGGGAGAYGGGAATSGAHGGGASSGGVTSSAGGAGVGSGAASTGAAAGGVTSSAGAAGASGAAGAAGAGVPGEAMPSSGDIEMSDGSLPEPNMDDVAEHGAHAAMIGLGVVGWLVVLLAFVLALAVFFRPVRRAILLRHLEKPLWKATPTRRVENLWLRALVALDDMGVRMRSDETPAKLAQRVADEMAQAKGERPAGIEAAAKIVERLEYAGRGLSPDEEGKMRAAVMALLAYFNRHVGIGKKIALAWAGVRAR